MPAVIVSEEQDENPPSIDSTATPASTQAEAPTPEPTPPPPPSVPEKFAGKTTEQLIAMYADLEKVTGRQGQELGELRSTHDQYIRTALEAAQRQPAPSNTETADDDTEFFVNPKAAIEKAVANHPLVKELNSKQQQTQQERAAAAFEAKHPDAPELVHDPEFRAWIDASPARRARLLAANNNYDFEAADDLFGTYKEIKAAKTAAAPAPAPKQDTSAAKAAALTAGKVPGGNASPTGAPTGKIFYRADLARLRNTDPERYHEMGEEILLAYKEKRVK